jgi:nucleoside-diphosphate-sugar epimerase
VKGNMEELLRVARSPYPLPLGALKAKRSILALENLAAAIDTVLTTPDRLRRPFIVADPEPITIAEMIAIMRSALGRRPALVPVPPRWLELMLRAAGRREIYPRLTGSLVADPSALMRLGWTPPVTTAEGLRAFVRSSRNA